MRLAMPTRRTNDKASARIVTGEKPASDTTVASVAAPLRQGREAFERRAWATAFDHLSAADRDEALAPDDLERLAVAGYLSGHERECGQIWTRAYHDLVAGGEIDRAARCSFSLGMLLFDRGQSAPGSGWIARGRRLLADHRRDSVERGYLMIPDALAGAAAGDFEGASVIFEQIGVIGDRFADDDLRALARQGRGRALTRLGRIQDGVALLDEAMIAVMTNEVSPIPAGIIYCSVIEACFEIFDLKRAQEWTAALGRWCDAQPELMPYRGTCLVRRSEILQVHGIWSEALAEATRACERLADRSHASGVGLAFYQVAEMRRLRGDFSEAADAYRAASEHGKAPEPGYALLRLAQGQIELAAAAIRRARGEANDRKTKARVLGACVEIFIATGDVAGARAAADELMAIATELRAPLITAYGKQAVGAVRLAESNPRAALGPLREAVSLWRALDIPYELARTGTLVGLACRALGDQDAAVLEFGAALRAFEKLGARPDADRLRELTRPEKEAGGTLTAREIQVLGLLATGRTNRAIAKELRISEKTVARHLANIFLKLGVSTRSEATAYAFRHQLT
jgi:DNA-binding CsgD family transcriptional regulator